MVTKESMGSGKSPVRKDFRKEASPSEAVPVSEKFLIELFSSSEFLSLLAQTRKKMEQHGGEFGFGIVKDLESDSVYLTNIATSIYIEDTDSTPLNIAIDKLKLRLRKKAPNKKLIIVGGLHFHSDTDPDPIIIPSSMIPFSSESFEGDLRGAQTRREMNEKETKFNFPTIEMIAVMTADGEIKILVYQESFGHSPLALPNIRHEIGESFYPEDIHSQEEVLDLLIHYQYKVAIVRTVKGKFDEQALKTLATFAFTPKKVENKV